MTTNLMDEPATCTVCGGLDDDDHKKHRQHPFTGPDQPEWVPPKTKPTRAEQKKDSGKAQQTMVIMPAPDLALRSLLVTRGIITPEQLEEADHALRIPRTHTDPIRADGEPTS